MMITTEHDIDAGIETVWALTEAVESWPAMTPTIRSVRRLDAGPMKVGSSAVVRQPMQRPATWTVTGLAEPELFEWGTTVFGITMIGRHRLSGDAQHCRNRLELEVTGRGSALFMKLFGKRMQQAIDTEGLGFKRRAERGS